MLSKKRKYCWLIYVNIASSISDLSRREPTQMTAENLDVRALLARRKPGYTLEAPFYLDQRMFDIDVDLIFSKHWIYVGPEPAVAEPGDFITVEVGRTSVLIVRDDDMEIRAFHNVCRHRGSRLCQSAQGIVGNLVCPYHQWTYNLQGTLVFAEHMGDGFDRSKHGLKPVHLRNIGGLLFICLADDPPADIGDMAREMLPYIAPHRVQDCKIAKQIDIVEDCNWKLTMENNRECYHCRSSHPELTKSLFEYGFGYQPKPEDSSGLRQYEEERERREMQWAEFGLPSRELEHLDDRVTGFRTQRLPLDRAGQSQTLTGEVACKKLLGDFTVAELGGLSFWTQPNSWHHFMSDHIVTFTVLPLGPDKTLVRTTWLVRKDAIEGVDYQLDNLTRVWVATNAQDRALVEQSHQGIRSSAYEPGPYSPYTEALVEKFCNWYIGRLTALSE
jgi:Rieske 2Fe-2S family protein